MQKFCKKKIVLLGTAALLITVLCIGVVHNAAIKDLHNKGQGQAQVLNVGKGHDGEQPLAKVDNSLVANKDHEANKEQQINVLEPNNLKQLEPQEPLLRDNVFVGANGNNDREGDNGNDDTEDSVEKNEDTNDYQVMMQHRKDQMPDDQNDDDKDAGMNNILFYTVTTGI